MNQNNNTKNLQVTTLRESIPTEISADYILPDRYPDVKKLLRVRTKPHMTTRYIEGNRLEIGGNVDYSVLFSADGEAGEELFCVHFSGEWGSVINTPALCEDGEISVYPRISAQTSKLANPRKITLKSTVTSDIKLSHFISCKPKCEFAAQKGMIPETERLWEEFTAKREKTFLSEPMKISEVIESEVHQPPIESIIDCDGEVRFYEVKPSLLGGHLTVSLKGEALISCLYKAAGEGISYRSFSRKIPISSTIDGDEFAAFFEASDQKSLEAYATADILELTASIAENGYGERKNVEVSADIDVTVHLIGRDKLSICTDAYSVEYETECNFGEYDCESIGKAITTNFSVGESLAREAAKIAEGAVVIDQSVLVFSPNITAEKGRGCFTADGIVTCIFADADGSFSSAEYKIPVRLDTGIGNFEMPISGSASIIPSDLRVGLSSERISFDFEASLSAEVFKREDKKILSAIKITEKKQPVRSPALTLCYPEKAESLWQIAKRYNTTTRAIESANKEMGRVLIIPS